MNRASMFWIKDVLRSPADEGAGGAPDYSGEGGSSAPDQTDRMSALEERIGSMAKLFGDYVNDQQSRTAKTELENFGRTLQGRVNEAAAAITTAEVALSEAYDAGDGTAIARAQRVLTEKVTAKAQAEQALTNYTSRQQEAERRTGGAGNPGTQPEADTTNLEQWKSKHRDWYGVDTEMTKAAHDINGRIRAAGVIPVGSKEYFAVIDREMKAKFPDRLSGTPQVASGGGGSQPSTGGRGRIAQSIVDGWRRMGINVDDAATVQRMIGHRQKLADKGILSATPVTDRIVSR